MIDLQGLLRSGLMARATGAPVRVGLAESREGSTRFYTHRIATVPGPSHMVDRTCWWAARAFGALPEPPRFLLPA
ncbi:MAG: glycosyltransferase family 9 protein [Isosphaeraceae bacterium]